MHGRCVLNRGTNIAASARHFQCPRVIALASITGRAEEALATAYRAEDVQVESGYRSGVLFALQAQGLALIAQNQLEEAESILQRMKALSQELGDIYPYLSMLLSLTLHSGEIEPYYRQFQWFDLERTLSTARSLSTNFKGGS